MTHDDTNRPDLHLAGDDALDHGLSDAQIDDMLRASGPTLPEPAPSRAARERVSAILDGSVRSRQRVPAGVRAALVGLAACVVLLASLYLGANLELRKLRYANGAISESSVEYASNPWDQVEVPPRLIVVNFNHDDCQRAAEVTEAFEQLASKHTGKDVFFLDLDVSGHKWDQAMSIAQVMGLECILEEAATLDTGMVKVVDCGAGRVLMTLTDGAQFPEAEALIARGG